MDLIQYPAILSTEAAPKMSDRYSFVNTMEVVEMFNEQGWNVRTASQVRSRKGGEKYAAHEVRLQKQGFVQVGDTVPEIIISNSHNGQKPLDIQMGLFRKVCTNGLTVPEKGLNEQFKIRHIGITPEDVKRLTEQIDANLSGVSERVKRMMETPMSNEAAIEFLRQSSVIPFHKGVEINFDDFLTAQRNEDANETVWSVFNIAQERLMSGDYKTTKAGKVRKAKPITSFLKANAMNIELWKRAEAFCN